MFVYDKDVLVQWNVVETETGRGLVYGPAMHKEFATYEEAYNWYQEQWEAYDDFCIRRREYELGTYVGSYII